MNITIQPSTLYGSLQIPASKSYMQRACAAALLKGGITTLHNSGISNDDLAAINTIQQLGATVTKVGNAVVIDSKFDNFFTKKNEIINLNLGESGLGLRMFTPIAALLPNTVQLSGSGSLVTRPMHFFTEVLPLLNVTLTTNDGYLPFTITGSLQPTNIEVDGSMSSQFITGLLMAYSYTNCTATITTNNLTSKPYIAITLNVLRAFGLPLPVNNNYEQFIFSKINKSLEPPSTAFNYTIESDWSSASFMLVAAAISDDVTFTGLNLSSEQADSAIIYVLDKAGVKMYLTKTEVSVLKSTILPFYFNATNCPDLFPPLVALAAYANGTTTLKGVNRLMHKESNRGLTLQTEFAKLGVTIHINGDEMQIIGTGKVAIANPNCTSHHDHRIAMALAVAALQANTGITINDAEAVNKSYPNFYNDLQSIGAKLTENFN